MLTKVCCPVCQSARSHYLYRDPRRNPDSENAILEQCDNCSHVYVNPMTPEDYSKLDPTIFAPYDCVPGAEARFDGFLGEVEALWGVGAKRRGRLLEIGCGMGRFAARAKSRGWDVEAVEPSPCAEHVRSLGVEVHECPITEAPLLSDWFDVVVGIEVLEHTTEPDVVLQMARELLTTPGMLYLTVPNFSCDKIRLGPRERWHEWPAMEPYGHLQYFKPGVLVELLHNTGFDRVTSMTSNGWDNNQLRIAAWRDR